MPSNPHRKHPAAVKTAVAQMHCVPGDVAANLAMIEGLVRLSARDGAGLIVLPEMSTTGYFISDRLGELAETEDGPTADHLAAIARNAKLHLAVGMAIREGGKFYDAQLPSDRTARALQPIARHICFRPSVNGSRPATRHRSSTRQSVALA